MANLTESDSWEAGIYQLEEDDPVLGGPTGIDNLAPRQLANRSLYQRLRNVTPWLATLDYPASLAFVSHAGTTWKSVDASTAVEPGTDETKWTRWAHTEAELNEALGDRVAEHMAEPDPHSQYLKVVEYQQGTAGTVFFTARSTPPVGSIKANGAVLSRVAYADLFAAIGTTFGVGDGATTFGIPDLRAEFIRGFDDGRGIDMARVLGSLQLDSMRSHKHISPVNDTAASLSMQLARGTGWPYGSAAIGVAGCNTVTSGVSQSASGEDSWLYTGPEVSIGGESRPRNVALLACIKY